MLQQSAQSSVTRNTGVRPNASAGTGADANKAQRDKYWDAKDYPKAIEAYKRAIVLNPSHAGAYYRLAACYHQTEQWQLAIAAWNHTLALKPEVNAFIVLGIAHRELKQYDEALKAYRSAIGLRPDSKTLAEVQFRIGRTYYELKQYQNAVTALREAVRLQPDNAAAQELLEKTNKMK